MKYVNVNINHETKNAVNQIPFISSNFIKLCIHASANSKVFATPRKRFAFKMKTNVGFLPSIQFIWVWDLFLTLQFGSSYKILWGFQKSSGVLYQRKSLGFRSSCHLCERCIMNSGVFSWVCFEVPIECMLWRALMVQAKIILLRKVFRVKIWVFRINLTLGMHVSFE